VAEANGRKAADEANTQLRGQSMDLRVIDGGDVTQHLAIPAMQIAEVHENCIGLSAR